MKEELEKCPNMMFFVSTDDIEIKKQLLENFRGNCIINNMDKTSRNTKKGMEDAVIDLYMLASTNKILGSYYSSYSEGASAIGHIPLVVVKK